MNEWRKAQGAGHKANTRSQNSGARRRKQGAWGIAKKIEPQRALRSQRVWSPGVMEYCFETVGAAFPDLPVPGVVPGSLSKVSRDSDVG